MNKPIYDQFFFPFQQIQCVKISLMAKNVFPAFEKCQDSLNVTSLSMENLYV